MNLMPLGQGPTVHYITISALFFLFLAQAVTAADGPGPIAPDARFTATQKQQQRVAAEKLQNALFDAIARGDKEFLVASGDYRFSKPWRGTQFSAIRLAGVRDFTPMARARGSLWSRLRAVPSGVASFSLDAITSPFATSLSIGTACPSRREGFLQSMQIRGKWFSSRIRDMSSSFRKCAKTAAVLCGYTSSTRPLAS